MKNTIIYLLGFPGTGKYTIAKEICKQADFKLVDNHLINNPLFTLIENDGKTTLPPRIWDNIGRVWESVMDTIIHISPSHYSFVLTNALTDQGKSDRTWFERVKSAAEQKNALFVPVRLSCSVEEMEKRIVQPDRKSRIKEINPESPRRNAENYTVLTVDHPNLLNLDVTNLTPGNAAAAILHHVKNCTT
jgi:AAA domain